MAPSTRRKRNKTKRQQRGRKKRPARKKASQRGGMVPFVVDFKRGFEATKGMINAIHKDLTDPPDIRKVERKVKGYKAEYAAYKRRGGSKGYTSWAYDKGYLERPTVCCVQ